jgi:hypothetical protein
VRRTGLPLPPYSAVIRARLCKGGVTVFCAIDNEGIISENSPSVEHALFIEGESELQRPCARRAVPRKEPITRAVHLTLVRDAARQAGARPRRPSCWTSPRTRTRTLAARSPAWLTDRAGPTAWCSRASGARTSRRSRRSVRLPARGAVRRRAHRRPRCRAQLPDQHQLQLAAARPQGQGPRAPPPQPSSRTRNAGRPLWRRLARHRADTDAHRPHARSPLASSDAQPFACEAGVGGPGCGPVRRLRCVHVRACLPALRACGQAR